MIRPLCFLSLVCLGACSQITITPAGAPVPEIAAGQVGGMATIEHGGTRIAIDNRESWEDTTEMVRGITNTLAIMRSTLAALDLRKAKNAAEAANEGAKIAAGTEGQRIAADQTVALKELDNQAAEAALAAEAAGAP